MNKNLARLTVFLYSFAVLSVVVGIVEILILIFNTDVVPNSDPKEMAKLISEELVSAAMILIVSPIASGIGLVILLLNKYRARWYFWSLLFLSLPYVVFVPIGTVIFALTWFYLLIKKQEFNLKTVVNVAT